MEASRDRICSFHILYPHPFLKVEVTEDDKESVNDQFFLDLEHKHSAHHCREHLYQNLFLYMSERYLKVVFIFSVYRWYVIYKKITDNASFQCSFKLVEEQAKVRDDLEC